MKKILLALTFVLTLLSSCSCESPGKEVLREFEFVDINGDTLRAKYMLPENAKVYISENRGSYYCRWVVPKSVGSFGILEYGVIRVKEIKK